MSYLDELKKKRKSSASTEMSVITSTEDSSTSGESYLEQLKKKRRVARDEYHAAEEMPNTPDWSTYDIDAARADLDQKQATYDKYYTDVDSWRTTVNDSKIRLMDIERQLNRSFGLTSQQRRELENEANVLRSKISAGEEYVSSFPFDFSAAKADIDKLTKEIDSAQARIDKKAREDETNQLYDDIVASPDYEEILQKHESDSFYEGSVGDILKKMYGAVFNPQNAGNRITAANATTEYDPKTMTSYNSGAKNKILPKFMNEKEQLVYNTYYYREEYDKAEEYYKSIEGDLEERARSAANTNAAQFAKDKPFWSSAQSVGHSVFGTPTEAAVDLVKYGIDAVKDPTTAKLDRNDMADTVNITRQTVSEDMTPVGRFFYNTTMSGLDSLLSGLAFGNVAGVTLALSAGSSAYNEGLDRGMSGEQAMAYGIASGLFEGIFESVSLGKLNALKEISPKTFKDVAVNIAKSIGVNASEETFTEIANIAYDTLLNGEYSDFQEMIDAGMSKEEALKQFVLRVLEAGASGALMGFGFGGVGSAIGYVNNKGADTVADIQNRMRQSASENQMYISFQNKVKDSKVSTALTDIVKGREVKDGDLQKVIGNEAARSILNEALGTDIKAENSLDEARDIISKAFESSEGKTPAETKIDRDRVVKSLEVNLPLEKAESLATIIADIGNGNEVSDKQIASVLNNKYARNALNKYLGRTVEDKFTESSKASDVRAVMAEGNYSRQGQAVLFGSTLGMSGNAIKGLSAVVANSHADVASIARAYNVVYKAAKSGKALADVSGAEALSPTQKLIAYEYGVMDGLVEQSESKKKATEEAEISRESEVDEGAIVTKGEETIVLVKENTKEQTRIIDMGKKLGVEVAFGKITKNGKNIDGLFDGKVLYINPNTTSGNAAYILFKHEFTHFLEKSTKYINFAKEVTESKAFSEWLKKKGFKNSTEYYAQIIADYKQIGKNLEKGGAQKEAVANFCAEMLYAKDDSMQRFVDTLSADNKRTFGGIIRDFIDWLKQKLGKTDEIAMLEKKYAEVFKATTSSKTEQVGTSSGTSKTQLSYASNKNGVDTYTEEQYNNLNNSLSKKHGGKNATQESTDTKLLGRGEISTSNRSKDNVGKYSKNTRTLQGLMGISDAELRKGNFRAGQSEWLEGYHGERGFVDPAEIQRLRRFLQSFRRKLSETKLNNIDTVGRKLPSYVIDNFEKTVFKTEDGTILSLWHWTNQIFNEFKYGDIGFHAGIFDAAYAIMFDKNEKGSPSVFKELYFNSKNPLLIEGDLGVYWTPHLVAVRSNVLNADEVAEIYSLEGSTKQQYNSPASTHLREMLKNKGYDSIIYINGWEDGISVIAFDTEQFYVVAENGIDVDYETQASYTPDKEATFTREILANMMNTVAESEREKNLLAKYKGYLERIDNNKAEIARLKEERKAASKAKKNVFTSKIQALEKDISDTERRLSNLEAMDTIKRLVEKERQAMADEAHLAGQMAQGRRDAKILRTANERLEAQKAEAREQQKQSAIDIATAREEGVLAGQMAQGRRDAKILRTANERLEAQKAEAREQQKQSAIDIATAREEGVLAGQMAQGRKDSEKLHRAIQLTKQRFRKKEQRAYDKRHTLETKQKIAKTVKKLDSLLRNGTKDRHIHFGLQDAVASALEIIDINAEKTIRYNKAIADLQRKLDDAIAREDETDIEAYTAALEKKKKNFSNFEERLEKMRKAYAKIRDGKADEIPPYYREEAKVIEGIIEETIGKIGGVLYEDMNLEQLEQVYKMYKVILTTVQNANKVFKGEKLADLVEDAGKIEHDLGDIKKLKEERWIGAEGAREYIWNELTPYYAFNRIGSETLMEYYWDLVRGQDTYARDVTEAKNFAQAVRKKYGYKNWDLDKTYTIKDKNGKDFSLSLKHMMSIYAYSKREQAKDHMEQGGFFFNDKETFRKDKKGLLHFIRSNETGYKVDEGVMTSILELMAEIDENTIAYVDEMQEYLTKMGEKGNEVTRKMWGIDIFKEKFYFPLKSKEDFIYQANTPAETSSLKNDGMTKETKPHASNPIVLEAFDSVWDQHVEKMSKYHAFVIPIDNLNKVINYGTWADGDSKSITTMIRERYSSAAVDYLNTFIKDLNGAKAPRRMGWTFVTNLVTKFKKTAVAASMSVVVQQPTAILRSLSEIDAKYFAKLPKAMGLNAKWELIQKHAPVAIIKDIGGYDAGGGRSVIDWMSDDTKRGIDKAMSKVDNLTMYGAALGDRLGWGAIWTAVENEIADTTSLERGSEEFYEAVGKRFTEVIVKTQVYDSTLSRSGFMRGKDGLIKMAMAFKGEPTLSINMIMDAILQATRGKISKKQMVRTIAAVYASIIAAALAKSLIYALRDDDEDESYLEKYGQAFGGTVAEWFPLTMPLTMLPIFSDVLSVLEGYTLERTDMSLIVDLYNAFTSLDSENKTTYRKIEDLAGAMGGLVGIPAKNILRSFREGYNVFENIFDGIDFGDIGKAFAEGVTGNEASKSESLYNAVMNKDSARINIYREGYKDESTYTSALKRSLRENDPRVVKSVERALLGDYTLYNNSKRVISSTSKYGVKLVNEAFADEREYVLNKLDEARKARKNGDLKEYNKIIDQLVARGYSKAFILKKLK